MPLTGLLTKYGFDGGWPSVFYCFGKFMFEEKLFVWDTCFKTNKLLKFLISLYQGGFGLLWFFAWTLIVHECPSDHPSISLEEKEYLQASIGTTTVNTRYLNG